MSPRECPHRDLGLRQSTKFPRSDATCVLSFLRSPTRVAKRLGLMSVLYKGKLGVGPVIYSTSTSLLAISRFEAAKVLSEGWE
jgi:hypothetical protein